MTLPYTIASSQPRIFNLMIDHGDDSEYNFILKPFIWKKTTVIIVYISDEIDKVQDFSHVLDAIFKTYTVSLAIRSIRQ